MEHLHPDDALAQLNEIYAAVADDGTYICVTPSRVSGPHDISRAFDDTPTGLHLQEYALSELVPLFRAAGFRRVRPAGMGGRGPKFSVPPGFVAALERTVSILPSGARKAATRNQCLAGLLGIWLIADK